MLRQAQIKKQLQLISCSTFFLHRYFNPVSFVWMRVGKIKIHVNDY